MQDDNAALSADLANPDIYRGDELVLSRETLHLIRTKFLWKEACYERISVQNFDLKPHRSRMLVRFDADFADLFEARGIKRDKRGVRTWSPRKTRRPCCSATRGWTAWCG